MLEANAGSSGNNSPVSTTSNTPGGPKVTVKDLLQNGDSIQKDEVDLHDDQIDDENKWFSLKEKHDMNAGVKRPYGLPPLFYNSQYMMECERAFKLANPYAYDMKLPYLQDLVWRYAQERIDSGLDFSKEKDFRGYMTNNSRNDGSNNSTEISPLDLQIPTLSSPSEHFVSSLNSSPLRASETQDAESPPSAQGFLYSSPIHDKLKDVLSKDIKDCRRKLLPLFNEPKPSSPLGDEVSSPPSQPVFPNPYEGFYLPPNTNNGFSFIKGQNHAYSERPPPSKKMKIDTQPIISAPDRSSLSVPKKVIENIPIAPKISEVNAVNVSDDSQTPVKKTRPKRGQYRKYNHELLMEAVRAVQRGEMSVHRAGSYYGVPHSTLEYKVKERHLLRQKKPREPRKKNTAGNTNGTIETSPTNKVPPLQQGNTNGNEGINLTPTSRSKVSDMTSHSHNKIEPPKENRIVKNKDKPKPYLDMLSSDQLEAAQSLQASLLMGSLGAAAAGALPNFPLAASQFPVGFGWPPLLNGNLPLPLPDTALAASLYSASGGGLSLNNTSASELLSGGGGLGMSNTSASELLKKLQQKVLLEAGSERPLPIPALQMDVNNDDDEEDGVSGDDSENIQVHNSVADTESGDSGSLIDVMTK